MSVTSVLGFALWSVLLFSLVHSVTHSDFLGAVVVLIYLVAFRPREKGAS